MVPPFRWLLGLSLLVAGAVFAAAGAQAHETRMAFLDLQQTSPAEYSLALKIPVTGQSVWPLQVEFPEECEAGPEDRRPIAGNLLVEQDFRCGWGDQDPHVFLRGLEGGYVDVLVRFEDVDGNLSTSVVSGGLTRIALESRRASVGDRIVLGMEHILLGPDHLLFVAGLLLLVRGGRRLVGAITAFTLAHSITLGMTILGAVIVPIEPVEAFIALSIVYLAFAVCCERGVGSGASGHLSRPWTMAFAFGLLHGFGFAGALVDTGLPHDSLLSTLFLFNLGIEAGQIIFASLVVVFLLAIDQVFQSSAARKRFEVSAAYCMGGVGSFWLLERVVGFW